MKILIVEDDYDFACMLKEDILKFVSEYVSRSHFYICKNNYYEQCRQINCDIAFIDIQLDGKDEGVALAKEILSINKMTPIVFVTSRDNLMHATFLVHPFYYIRKSNYKEDFLVFCDLYKKQLQSRNYITLSYKHNKSIILISNIYYIETYEQTLFIHTNKGVYRDSRTLKSFLAYLNNDSNFLQIHKSFVINLRYVYIHSKEKVILLNKLEIKIGRKFAKDFEKKYKEYLLK